MNSTYRLLAFAALLFAADCSAALQSQPLDLSQLPHAAQPNVTVDPHSGKFVLSWQARLRGGCAALQVAEMDLDGGLGAISEVARGCDWFVNWADFPSLVVADNGDWLTHWLRKTAKATYAYEIVLSRSTNRGQSWSDPMLAHLDGTPTEHGFVSMAPAGDDQVLLLWLDGRRGAEHAGSNGDHHHHEAMSLRSALVNRQGELSERTEIDARVCSCCGTDLVRKAGGAHVAVFRDRSKEEIRDIGLIERNGKESWRGAGVLHADGWKIAGCPVNGPGLAAAGERVLAVWPTMADSDQLRVRARVLGAESEFVELEAGAGVLGRVDAIRLGERWLLSWIGAGEAGQAALRIALLSDELAVLERLDVATMAPSRNIGMPRMAGHGDQAVLLWTDTMGDLKDDRGRAQTRVMGVRITAE